MAASRTLTLTDRVAIVTGAGRGLGRAYALELARRGARVVVNDAGFNMAGDDTGDHGPADSVVREVRDAGGQAVASYHDIAQAHQAHELVAQAVSRFGQVDILVNNAGNNRHAIFPAVQLEDMRAILDVHLIGPMLLSQAVYPHMVARRHGRIVLTTSQVGFQGKVDSVAYGAAKNAVIGLMHGMKLDAARHGILVNCISPLALTRMGGIFPKALAQWIDPALVAAAVVWLCSDECTLSGEVLIAGGGHFARACTMESQGIDVPGAASGEMVRRRWKSIASMRGALTYADALQAVGATFTKVKQRMGLAS